MVLEQSWVLDLLDKGAIRFFLLQKRFRLALEDANFLGEEKSTLLRLNRLRLLRRLGYWVFLSTEHPVDSTVL
jgi:hypothetical protein